MIVRLIVSEESIVAEMCGITNCKNADNLEYCGHCGISYCLEHKYMDVHSHTVNPDTADTPGWVKYNRRKPGRLKQSQIVDHEYNHIQRRRMHRPHLS